MKKYKNTIETPNWKVESIVQKVGLELKIDKIKYMIFNMIVTSQNNISGTKQIVINNNIL